MGSEFECLVLEPLLYISTVPSYHLFIWKYCNICSYSGDLKTDHLKSGGRILNGLVFKMLGFSHDFSYSPNHLKNRPFKIETFLSGFLMAFDKMPAIC